MQKYKTQSTRYYCQKVSSIVKISSKFLIIDGSVIDEVDKNVQVSFDCDQKFKCGICNESCRLISFNWKACINPQCIHSRMKNN